MLSEERYRAIEEQIAQKGSVTVNALTETLNVSVETVRRDLVFLEAKGKLRRVFGGAVAVTSPVRFADYAERERTNLGQKEQIAEKLADLVCEGDIISVDSGTTPVAFAEELKRRFRRLTVITYSLRIFHLLKDSFDVILSGGEFYGKEEGFFGELAVRTVERLHAGKCFIFPSAVSVDYGVEDYVPSFVPVQEALIRSADHVIVAADSSKFSARALIRLCDLSPDHLYVTDAGISESVAAEFEKKGFSLMIADTEKTDHPEGGEK